MHSVTNDIYRSIFPNGKYLTYGYGNFELLLTAPHGGGMKPIHMPKRKYGQRGKDTFTRRLIEEIVDIMYLKPFYIYSDVHRSRVDLNRDIQEAAQGNYYAEKIWEDWNKLIANYQNEIYKIFRKGLYVDIHSHNDGNYFELGYNLNAKDYRNLFHTGTTKSLTTLDALKHSKYEMIFGKYSFKRTLEDAGLPVLFPSGNEVYFNGGRNIEVFNGNGIGAIQIECPVSILKNRREDVAKVLNNAIMEFMLHFVWNEEQT